MMQTLFHYISNKRLSRAGRLGLIAILALVTVIAAVPQPALAATCSAYHTVKMGDTRTQIAHTYDMPWKDIAKANHLKIDGSLKVGQVLCIPSKTAPGAAQTGTMSAFTNGDAVVVKMSDFPERAVWSVLVSDTQNLVSGVYKIGQMKVLANTTVARSFKLPVALRNTHNITVCVKNMVKFDKICHQVIH